MGITPIPPFAHPPIHAERVTGPDTADAVTLGVMHFGAVTDPRGVVDLFVEGAHGVPVRIVLSPEMALALAAALLASPSAKEPTP